MKVFIDESGIHKAVDHSCFAFVYIEVSASEDISRQIEMIEHDLGIHIFHWAKRDWNTRTDFIKRIAKLDFKIKIAIIKNPIRFDSELENILSRLVIEKHINEIVIDGKKSKRYQKRLKKVLRDKGISVKKLRTGNDQGFPVLRIADAVAGVSRSFYDDPHGKSSHLYKLLEAKIIVVLKN